MVAIGPGVKVARIVWAITDLDGPWCFKMGWTEWYLLGLVSKWQAPTFFFGKSLL